MTRISSISSFDTPETGPAVPREFFGDGKHWLPTVLRLGLGNVRHWKAISPIRAQDSGLRIHESS